MNNIERKTFIGITSFVFFIMGLENLGFYFLLASAGGYFGRVRETFDLILAVTFLSVSVVTFYLNFPQQKRNATIVTYLLYLIAAFICIAIQLRLFLEPIFEGKVYLPVLSVFLDVFFLFCHDSVISAIIFIFVFHKLFSDEDILLTTDPYVRNAVIFIAIIIMIIIPILVINLNKDETTSRRDNEILKNEVRIKEWTTEDGGHHIERRINRIEKVYNGGIKSSNTKYK